MLCSAPNVFDMGCKIGEHRFSVAPRYRCLGYALLRSLQQLRSIMRYRFADREKAAGVTYTPRILSDFVARKIIEYGETLPAERPVRVLDPAVGDGELLVSLLRELSTQFGCSVEVHGFETAPEALARASARLDHLFPCIPQHLVNENFLEYVAERHCSDEQCRSLWHEPEIDYDLIIANPPYVRTQILGAAQAQLLSKRFGLSGRVDLYYAFILGIARVLSSNGTAGIIVSNRFMTTKSGSTVRKSLLEHFTLRHAWDLGDTKLFDAAVLPAVLLLSGKSDKNSVHPRFSSIYETSEPATSRAQNPIDALGCEGVVSVQDQRRFKVEHGRLDTNGSPSGGWRVANRTTDSWLAIVNSYAWGRFRDIGRIRVGVKTCADPIFIRDDWQETPMSERPELLRPITTHHIARRFKACASKHPKQMVYPHEVVGGKRQPVDLDLYPRSQAYLERHRSALERRKYVTSAGRAWYEIWVPQDPDAWKETKLVFRDISESPTFWIDKDGSIINGDCYWMICDEAKDSDLLWLAAAVGNSTFVEFYYDLRFRNKLYAGRRRFMSQYVEEFPIPDPHSDIGKELVARTKLIYERTPPTGDCEFGAELDPMVWKALTGKEKSFNF